MTTDDRVTGARAAIEVTVEVPPAVLWDLLTDVSRHGEWSPECEHAAWLDTDDPGPRVGARFRGRNRFANGQVNEVTCTVVAAERPTTFAWVVGEDPAQPSTTWRYELSPAGSPDRTLVRHTFEHGPGASGLRDAIARHPTKVDHILTTRLTQLEKHMTETLAAMTATARK
ncbi:MAG: SRPBCC family protein [Actinocatenispora sp.]